MTSIYNLIFSYLNTNNGYKKMSLEDYIKARYTSRIKPSFEYDPSSEYEEMTTPRLNLNIKILPKNIHMLSSISTNDDCLLFQYFNIEPGVCTIYDICDYLDIENLVPSEHINDWEGFISIYREEDTLEWYINTNPDSQYYNNVLYYNQEIQYMKKFDEFMSDFVECVLDVFDQLSNDH